MDRLPAELLSRILEPLNVKSLTVVCRVNSIWNQVWWNILFFVSSKKYCPLITGCMCGSLVAETVPQSLADLGQKTNSKLQSRVSTHFLLLTQRIDLMKFWTSNIDSKINCSYFFPLFYWRIFDMLVIDFVDSSAWPIIVGTRHAFSRRRSKKSLFMICACSVPLKLVNNSC